MAIQSISPVSELARRRLAFAVLCLVALIAAEWAGDALVHLVYQTPDFPLLGPVLEGRAIHPVERYLNAWHLTARVGAAAVLVLAMLFITVRGMGSGQRAHAYASVVVLVSASVVLRVIASLHWHIAVGPRFSASASIARNFAEFGLNILYPRIDWGGDGPGFVEEGFQAYTWLVGAASRAFGHLLGIGHLISGVAWVAAAMLTWRIARRFVDESTSLVALAMMLFAPLGLRYGQEFMPDAMIVCLVTLSVFAAVRISESPGYRWFLVATPSLALAGMMKPQVLVVLLPLAYVAFRREGWRFVRSPVWVASAVLSTLPAFLWLRHGGQIWERFGNTAFPLWLYPTSDASLSYLTSPLYYTTILRRLVVSVLAGVGVPLVVLGLTVSSGRISQLPRLWLLAVTSLILLTAGGMGPHGYYLLPYLPSLAILGAQGTTRVLQFARSTGNPNAGPTRATFLAGTLALILVAGTATWWTRLDRNRPEELWAFAADLRRVTEPHELVALGTFVSRGPVADRACCRRREPNDRYLGHEGDEFFNAHRKGWSLHYEDWTIPLIDSLQQRGATIFATSPLGHRSLTDSSFLLELEKRSQVLVRAKGWTVYRLTPVQRDKPVTDEQ